MQCNPGGTRRRVPSEVGAHSRQENRTIGQVKVQWKHLSPEEATWDMESNMREAYPYLFQEDEMEE